MIKIAFRYALRNRRRTSVTVVGIAVSVMLMFSLVQMGDCIMAQFSELVTTGMKRDFTILGVTYDQIQQAEELLNEQELGENYMMTMKAGVWYENEQYPVDVIGVAGNLNYFQGTEVLEGEFPRAVDEICVEKSYIEQSKTSLQVGDEVELLIYSEDSGKEEKFVFLLSGVIDDVSTEGKRVWTNLETAKKIQEMLECKDLNNNAIAVVAEKGEHDSEKVALICTELEQQLKLDEFYKKHLKINEEKDELFLEEDSGYRVFSDALKGCSLLIMICMIIFVFNTCYISTIGKMRELATMRCIGLSKKNHNKVLVWEIMIIGHIGIILGVVAGTLLNYFIAEKIVDHLMLDSDVIPFRITLISYLEVYIVAIVAIFGALGRVLFKMRKCTILEAMKYTENSVMEYRMKGKSILLLVAKRNLQRNRSKSNTLLTTMSISVLLCLVIFSVFFSVDIYKEDVMSKGNIFDYEIYTTNVLKPEVPNESYRKIQSKLGKENVFREYRYDFVSVDTNNQVTVVGFDDALIQLLISSTDEIKELDPKQPVAILYRSGCNEEYVGDVLTFSDGNQEIQISISDSFAGKENCVVYSSFGYDFDVVIINKAMAEKLEIPMKSVTGLLLQEAEKFSVSDINQCFEVEDTMQVISLKTQKNEAEEQLLGMMAIAIYILISTVLLTCTIINSILQSNLIMRRKEYSVMRALGLSNKSLYCVCCLENLILYVKAYVVAVCISVPINLYVDYLLDDGVYWSVPLYIGVFVAFALLIVGINVVSMKSMFCSSIMITLREE